MGSVNLLLVCASAFTAVFLLLTLLALVMRLIMALFPERPTGIDAAVFAAVTSTVSTVFPGTKIKDIEEIK